MDLCSRHANVPEKLVEDCLSQQCRGKVVWVDTGSDSTVHQPLHSSLSSVWLTRRLSLSSRDIHVPLATPAIIDDCLPGYLIQHLLPKVEAFCGKISEGISLLGN